MKPENGLAALGNSGVRAEVHLGSAAYPRILAKIESAPESMFVVDADSDWKKMPAIAIVGARKATPYGLACADMFAKIAVENGFCVVSGGARGCDTAAHYAAIEAGGKTVAVLGCGCDVPYPNENAKLFRTIVEKGGAIVSEQPFGTQPMPYMFRERNRIVSGLSMAVLVCECGLPSGVFTMCEDSFERGRHVLAVPGSVFSDASKGTNALIASGTAAAIDSEAKFVDWLEWLKGFWCGTLK